MFEGPSAEPCASASEDLCAQAPAAGKSPPPAGFAQVAAGKRLMALCAHYRVSHHTITRWRREAGLSTNPHRAETPADFADKAPAMGNPALAHHYGVSVAVVARWRRQSGLGAFKVARPVPRDFAIGAARYTIAQHALFHSVSQETVRKWCQALGVSAKPGVMRLAKATVSAAPPVAGDTAAQAAHHLRRHFATVFRADVLPVAERKHLPGNGRNMWVVAGRGALPAAEVIALAEARGFDRRAWARI
ncbi:MAG: hypothetical protein PGN09_07540 [Sphingomonas fennica]